MQIAAGGRWNLFTELSLGRRIAQACHRWLLGWPAKPQTGSAVPPAQRAPVVISNQAHCCTLVLLHPAKTFPKVVSFSIVLVLLEIKIST